MATPLIRSALALCILACVSCATPGGNDPNTETHQRTVASVNGATIKYAEFKQELDSTYQRFHDTGQLIDGSQYERLKEEVLESLINLLVLDQYSRELGLEVEASEVDRHYQKAVARYDSARAYRKALKNSGLTEKDIRTRLKRTLAAQLVVQSAVASKIVVTEEEVRGYYDQHTYEFEHDVQVHAAHILIKVNPFADDDVRQKARQRLETILDRIKAGEDFAALAKTHSEGPSKVNGGDLGYFGAAQMAPAFETAAFSLNPGEVSGVVKTQFGYHLIKVYDRKPAGKESYTEAAPRLKARFHQERLNERLQELVGRLKAKARIERFPLN